jgi:ribonucleoside-diphosphate reductase alpha chain
MYNCSSFLFNSLDCFAELMYILMNGCGGGVSVERKYVDMLPEIKPMDKEEDEATVVFEDSKRGWAEGFDKVVHLLWQGVPFKCDYSKLRPKGARLKTFGGRSSGKDPLVSLVDFTKNLVDRNRGSKLRTIDVHDICCMISQIVVSGGVRRSAVISMSDLDDQLMATAKSGEFWNTNPQRFLANNSAIYERKPDMLTFMREWQKLVESNSGERGIVNRQALVSKVKENGRRDHNHTFVLNACGETILRGDHPKGGGGLCNLSEVIVRPSDDFETLKEKVKIATMIGTWQSTFTNFKFVRNGWALNAIEERLLGVSLTGTRDHKILNHVNDNAKKWLSDLKHVAIATNKKVSQKLGINRAAAICLNKPSGTTSQMVNSSSGVHPRYSSHYIRRVRISATDPLFTMLAEQGVPFNYEVGQSADNCNTFVLDFPTKSPSSSVVKDQVSAIEQLSYYLMFREFWCEHQPSITVYVKDNEWLKVGSWVYDNFDKLGGVTFLPSESHAYELAPYEEVSKERYDDLVSKFPEIDFSKLPGYEKDDNTIGSKEFACSGGNCEVK